MSSSLSAIPDITLQRAVPASATVGRLAGRLAALAADPPAWWHLVRFDPDEIVAVTPAEHPGLCLVVWPPGRTGRPYPEAAGLVLMVLAGELVERSATPDGWRTRTLPPNRIRVHGAGHLHEFANPGPAYAVYLGWGSPFGPDGRLGHR